MKIVYPWDLRKFNGTALDQELISGHLRRLKYNLKEADTKPNSRTCSVISEVIPKLINPNNQNWYVACSNSSLFLNYLSLVLPITFALTTKTSCKNVNTNTLLKSFLSKEVSDAFIPDIAGIESGIINKSALVVYENFFSSGVSTIKFESKFTEFFTERSKHKFPMLFTVLYRGEADKIVDEVLEYAEKTYGNPTRCLLQEKAFFKYFEMTEKKIECQAVPI